MPPGAFSFRDFVSPETASRLLAEVDANPWRDDLKRRVQHYGWRYDYRARQVTQDLRLGPLPGWLAPLAEAVGVEGGFGAIPDQVIVNEYLPGQGISAHIDCVPCFGPVIASLSLGGMVEMEFRHAATGVRRSHVLPEGSLLVLSGPARYEWTHAIPARRSDVIEGVRTARTRRVSLTFRSVTQTP
ncbi:alpha-ketoglutarate-dependent dioxygenase AlkB [Alkalicaulis satelles]|uniref:Alpha-ketoglutarate-dependent dioxygenase AlkB n=1 Tax=Alkalicaulis satelles TaxID=2609175 RepID=A0A5M6ZHQ1_9PROT|nr:alpha-ketoglutarate-dependent dioxygenase AlkB [Alkalicaulis satelles]KAA5803324.1 alpha-ketoglutarate-dependent dioxygenase AlkB [Alkalicaulis satelles]